MVADATRGVKFVFSAAVDPDAAKAFEAMEKRVADLQKSMNLTLKLEGRTGPGPNGRNGNGSPQGGGAAARQADRAARERERDARRAFLTESKWNRQAENAVNQREASERASRKRLSDMRRDADERDRVSAERSAEKQRAFERDILDQQIKDLKRAAKERQQIIAEAAREDAHGWKRMSAIGRESFTTGRKTAAGFDALSAMGRAALPRDRFAEGLQKLQADRAARTGWSGLGASGADAQQRLNALRDIERKDHEDRKRALDSQKGQLREINSAAYDVVHAFGQLTRAATQFGLIGQRDMMKVLDTIFAVEGGINAVQGAMGAVRAIRGIRGAGGGISLGRAVSRFGPAAALSAGSGMRLAGHLLNSAGLSSFGAAGGIGLAGAGATALAAGGIGLAGSIADRRRGVAGNVGGFWDTVGTRGAGIAESGAGLLLRATAGIDAAFNEPYGLTSRQKELRKEEFLRKQIGLDYIPGARTALENMSTERKERFTREDIAKRAELDRGHATDFENRFGLARNRHERALAIRERGRMMEANFSPLTREGALFADTKRTVADLGREISELSKMQAAAVQNRMERMQPGQQVGGEFDASSRREIEAFEMRIRDLKTEQARITRETQRTAIDGLKQQLELEKSRATTAQGRFQSALEARQSTEERLGRMTPGKVAAIARSKEKAERGDQLSLHDIENLEQGDERSQFLAKQAARQRFRGFYPGVRGTLVDEEEAKEQMKMRSAEAAAGHRDELNRTIIGAEKAAGLGRPEPIRVDVEFQKKLTLELKEMETIQRNRAVEFANEISPKIMEALNEDRERLVDEIMAKFRGEIDQRTAKQNQGGRAAAGQ